MIDSEETRLTAAVFVFAFYLHALAFAHAARWTPRLVSPFANELGCFEACRNER